MSSHDRNILIAQAADAQGAATTLHSMFRFLRTVRHRSGVLLACIVMAGVGGAAYYISAVRMYESNASLYIVRIGSGVSEERQNDTSPNNDMPTFQRLMASETVIDMALKRLRSEFRTDFQGLPETQWIRRVRDNLSVTSAFGTNVLDLSYRSRDPRSAAAMLVALLIAYQEYMDETHRGSSEENLQTLEATLRDTMKALDQKTKEAMDLKARYPDIIVTHDQQASTLNVVAERIRFLSSKYAEAQEETAKSRTMLLAIETAIRNGDDILAYAMNEVDAVGRRMMEETIGLSGYSNYHLQRITEELLDLQGQLNRARAIYGIRHREIIRLSEEIRQRQEYLADFEAKSTERLQEKARTELTPRLLQMAQHRLQTSLQNETELRKQLTIEQAQEIDLERAAQRLSELKRETEQLYAQQVDLWQKKSNIELNKDTAIRSRIASKPSISPRPVSPRLAITGLLSLLLGTVSGLALIWVLDILDDRFRNPEELKLQLDTQVLSMVPRMDELPGEGINRVMSHGKPHAKEVEAFRALRTSIGFSPQETTRLVVTSTEPGDGKTTVSSNLAVAFAQSGRKTLVIDADMRRPGLSTLLNLRDETGLSRILRSTEELSVAIDANLRPTGCEGLDVISCGPRPVNPAELLASERFANLLAWAETRYDQIIVDAPPVLAVSDPVIVGRLVDAVVLVVRPDKDRRRMVIRAAESIRTLGCSLLGIVINHLAMDDSSYGYGYGYGYGYSYGHEDHPEDNDSSRSSAQDAARGLSILAAGGESESPSWRKRAA